MNEDQKQFRAKVPTTIFSGFLGSGKTTIISHLIDALQKNNVQVAYIKNEIGDTDVDTQLLRGKDIQTKELLNGCICCTLVGPFASAVNELIETFQPDRIIIEASGAADPSAIALMVSSHPFLLRDGVISVIDVENFEGYKDLSVTAQNQTQFTDIIIFNKVEAVSTEQKKVVVGYVRELNTHSPIIESPNGKVDPELIFGLDPSQLEPFLSKHEQHHETDHIAIDNFSAFTIRLQKPVSQEQVSAILTSLPKAIFRTKGLFCTADQTWISFNGVGPKLVFTPLKKVDTPSESIFVFIGVGVNNYEDQVRTQFEALTL